MIIDTLNNLQNYLPLIPSIKDVLNFLELNNLGDLPDGLYDINKYGAYVNIQTVPQKLPIQAKLETHRKMIDIQIPISHDETMGYSPLEILTPSEYDSKKDVAFHCNTPQSFLNLSTQMFAIFFPSDGHAPGITQTVLRKAIFKLPISNL